MNGSWQWQPPQGGRYATRAFTLVELLVAVAVFAIVAGTAYTALDRMSLAHAAHRQHAEEFQALQMAVTRLDLDLRQLIDRPIRADTTLLPALHGGRHVIEATRAGWDNPAAAPRSHLQRFAWQVVDQRLVRRNWPVTDRIVTTPVLDQTLLEQVRSLELRYLDPQGGWQSQWPPEGSPPTLLPHAVDYRLELQDGRTFHRLVAL